MTEQIQTVTGATTPEALGRTLMHEHLLIGYPGWEADTLRPGPTRDEIMAKFANVNGSSVSATHVQSMIARGFQQHKSDVRGMISAHTEVGSP